MGADRERGTGRARTTRALRGAMRAAALLACACALSACAERENEADEAARAALTTANAPALRTAPAVRPLPDAAGIAPPPVADTAPIGQWSVQAGPVAAWGVPDSEAVLTFACNDDRDEVVVRRDAVGLPVGIGVVTFDADGLRRGLPAVREVTALGPRLVSSIPAHDPLLDRLRTATRLRVLAGEDALLTTAPGAALVPVLDACRDVRTPAPVAGR